MRQSYLTAGLAAATLAFASLAAGCHAQSSAAGAATSASDKAFGERVRAYLLAHPEVIGEAILKLQADEAAEKSASAASSIAAHRQALEHDRRDGVAGNPAGPVTLVEFFDYRCPYCRAAEPALEALLKTHPNVRLVLKEFPILDVEDHTHISEDAARAALGALPQGRYLQVHRALLARPHLDEDGIRQVLAAAGVNGAQDSAVAHSKAVSDQLAETHQLAMDLGVDGTPAFVIGDQLIAGADTDAIEKAIGAASRKK